MQAARRDGIYVGNAQAEAEAHRGWLVGHFIPRSRGAAATSDVEVKWGQHAAGESRTAWATGTEASTMTVLIRGRFRIHFSDREDVLLAAEGDYVVWPPGVGHRWRAEEDSLIVSVRWPSRPGDAVET
jgi:quercetin dioxygenase-like cupin family protein